MVICGREFNAQRLEEIQQIINADPNLSRRALSREICRRWDWRSQNGRFQEMSCRKALAHLDRAGEILLPKIKRLYRFSKTVTPKKNKTLLTPHIQTDLASLGTVSLLPVKRKEDSATWNACMQQHHYLGAGPLCGAQIRYLIQTDNGCCLGGLSFSSPTWKLKARDSWIGWSEAARQNNLHRVVCQSRFLIAPTVKVPHLASHALSLARKRVQADWEQRYGYAPVLLETFVDPKFFKGTCYQADNWIHLGQSAARSTAYQNGKISSGKKEIYVYPLQKNAQTLLSQQPQETLHNYTPLENPKDWAEKEFGNARLYDARLQRRLVQVARDFFQQPGAHIPQACEGSGAKTKAAYRLFANEQVQLQSLLQPHQRATLDRIQAHRVVLAVQDTTTLSYTTHPETKGLGPTGRKSDKTLGIFLHDTVAFTPEGTPLGVVDACFWSRDKVIGKEKRREGIPLAQKESNKWFKSYEATAELQAMCPETMLVSVGDREGDIFELFSHAQHHPEGPKLLIRAEASKRRKTEQSLRVEEELGQKAAAGYLELKLPRQGSRQARTAKLEIRFDCIRLCPPQGREELEPVSVWIVRAQEQLKPSSQASSPLEWTLVTTVETSTFSEACERVSWYAKRWGIEVYHRTLKSGCRIQDHQLRGVEQLKKCLAVDMVVAWRIYWLTQQGRETPDMSCVPFFREEEWKVLQAYHNKALPGEKPPKLAEAVAMVAKLGGYLGRKNDGPPGTMTLWRGLMKLEGLVAGFALATAMQSARDGP